MLVHVIGNLCRDTTLDVLRFPVPGETIVAEMSVVGLGGKGLNQAVAASRAGAAVVLHAAIGRRDSTDLEVRLADYEGMKPHLVALDQMTDASMILVQKDGENIIVSSTSCARAFKPIAAVASLCPGDIMLMQGNLGLAETIAALGAGRRAGVMTVLNPSPLWAEGTPDWGDVDLLILNSGELENLAGTPDPEMGITTMRSRGVKAVAVTLGARGALYGDARGVVAVAAPAVTARDASGAGDAFCGVLVGLLARRVERGTALSCAVAAASLSVTRVGALASCPTAVEISDLEANIPIRSAL